MKDSYLFLPPEQVGEVGAVQRLPVLEEASFNEACDLAHGKYRGWRAFKESAISVLSPTSGTIEKHI